MSILRKNKLPKLVFTSFGLASVAIVPIAASCTSSNSVILNQVETSARNYLRTLSQLKVQEQSTNDQVVWNTYDPLPSSLATAYGPLEFSLKPYGSEKGAALSPISDWSLTLPTALPDLAEARHLWVRIRTQNTANATSQAFELTQSSNIRTIKIRARAYASFAQFNLFNVRFEGTPTDLVVQDNLPSELSQYIDLTYRGLASEYLPLVEFKAYLKARASEVDAAALTTLSVRAALKPYYESKVLYAPQEAKPDLRGFKPSLTTITSAPLLRTLPRFFEEFSNVSWLNGSVNSLILWPSTLPSLNADLANVYFAPEYNSVETFATTTQALTSTSSNWTTTLPASYPATGTRTLWVRIRGRSTGDVGQANDMSDLLRVNAVPLAVRDLPSFYQFNLANVKLSGNLGAARIDFTLPEELSAYVKVEFQLARGRWIDAAAMIEYLRANASSITRVSLATLKVRISAINQATAYLSAEEATPNFDALTF